MPRGDATLDDLSATLLLAIMRLLPRADRLRVARTDRAWADAAAEATRDASLDLRTLRGTFSSASTYGTLSSKVASLEAWLRGRGTGVERLEVSVGGQRRHTQAAHVRAPRPR